MNSKLGKYVKISRAIYKPHLNMIGKLVAITIRDKSYVNGETEYIVEFDDLLSVEQCHPRDVHILTNDELMVEEL